MSYRRSEATVNQFIECPVLIGSDRLRTHPRSLGRPHRAMRTLLGTLGVDPAKEYTRSLCAIQSGPFAVPPGPGAGQCGSTGVLPSPQ